MEERESSMIEEMGASTPRTPLLGKQGSSYTSADAGFLDPFGNSSFMASFTADARASITPLLVFSTFVAVCGSFCYGCAMGYSSPVESGVIEDLGLSVTEYSIFGSILTIGGISVAIFSGKVTNLIGPVKMMWISELFALAGWIAIAFTTNVWWLYIGRLLVGIGAGVLSYVVPIYVAEIATKDLRGLLTSTNTLMVCAGFALVYCIGDITSWRVLSLIAATPSVVQLIGLFFIPESPRWLAKIGRQKECETTLKRFRGKYADVSQELIDISNALKISQQGPEAKIIDLFKRRYAYATIAGVGLMFLRQIGGNNGIFFYASSIFSDANFSTTVGTISISLIQLPGAIASSLLMDVLGRRTLLLISSAGTCIFLLLVGLAFYLQDLDYLTEATPVLVFIGMMVGRHVELLRGYTIIFGIGLSGIPWVIMSEIFPLAVKAPAGSLVNLTNWTCSWIVTFTFNFMMQWSSPGTFFIFGGVCGLTVLFVYKFVPETKGRTLENIQAAMITSSSDALPWL